MTTLEQRLAAETEAWTREGLVFAEQAESIRRRYDRQAPVVRRDRIVTALSLIGAVGVGLGVILFFAANWDGIPRFARLALLVGTIVGTCASGMQLRETRPRVGHALLLLGCLLFGASLFLVGQMENVSTWNTLAFLLWAAAAAAGALLLESAPFATLAVLTFGAWIVYALVDAEDAAAIAPALGLYGAALYGVGTRLRGRLLGPARGVGATLALGVVFPATFDGVTEELARAHLGAFATALLVGLAVCALAGATALALSGRRWEALAAGGFVAVLLSASVVDLGPVVANVVFATLALGAVAAGYTYAEPWLVNLGLAAVVLEVAVRFFDFFAQIMPRSLAFLVGGTLVLTLAWALERGRTRLVAGMSR